MNAGGIAEVPPASFSCQHYFSFETNPLQLAAEFGLSQGEVPFGAFEDRSKVV